VLKTEKNRWKRTNIWAWIILIIGLAYFFLPLIYFRVQPEDDYRHLHSKPTGWHLPIPSSYRNFGFSVMWAIHNASSVSSLAGSADRLLGALAHAPPATVVEFITLMPFVVPAVVLVIWHDPPVRAARRSC
jgi:hypothetical protein